MNNRAQMTMAAEGQSNGGGGGGGGEDAAAAKDKGWISDSCWPLHLAVVTHTYCVQNKGS